MRPDLAQTKLGFDTPPSILEAAATAFTWLNVQLYKEGFLERELLYADLNSSGRYVHSGFFVNNSIWLSTAWQVMESMDYFSYETFSDEMKFSIQGGAISPPNISVIEIFVRLYLNTLRQTLSLGINYGNMYSNGVNLNKVAFLKENSFEITSENPFIEMIDYLIRGHNTIAMQLAFLATAPNGHRFTLLTSTTAENSYYEAVPSKPWDEFRIDTFNPIPNKDWMMVG